MVGEERWNFYFDESVHDRKITSVENNINIYLDNIGDIYVDVFNGFKSNNLESITRKYRSIIELYIVNGKQICCIADNEV